MEIKFYEYTPDDFFGYVDCLNSFYHGNHPYPQYFQKDFLQNLIDSGKLIITLAKTEEGKVVGTSTAQLLEGMFENTVLLGMRFLMEEFRGMGIGDGQEDFLLTLVEKKFPRARSVYADVVTNNRISQKTLYKKGFRLCGMNMMFYREPSYSPKYPENDFKLSMAVYVKNVNKKAVTINPPEKYKDMISELYQSLDTEINVTQDEFFGETEFSTEILERHNTTEFFVSVPGSDNEKILNETDKRLAAGDTISAYIDISRYGCEKLCEELCKKGFYFCGIKPLNENSEYLIMCNTKNHKGDFLNIRTSMVCRKIANYFIEGAQQNET